MGNDLVSKHIPGTGTAEVKRLSRNTSSYLRRWCKLPFIGVLHVIFTHHSVRILLSSFNFLIKTPTHSWCRKTMTASAANRSGKMTDGPSTQHVTALGLNKIFSNYSSEKPHKPENFRFYVMFICVLWLKSGM